MSNAAEAAQAAAAAAAAFRASAIESWTLYAIGVLSTFLRFYARMRVAGFRGLQTEDYLMVLAIVCLPMLNSRPQLLTFVSASTLSKRVWPTASEALHMAWPTMA